MGAGFDIGPKLFLHLTNDTACLLVRGIRLGGLTYGSVVGQRRGTSSNAAVVCCIIQATLRSGRRKMDKRNWFISTIIIQRLRYWRVGFQDVFHRQTSPPTIHTILILEWDSILQKRKTLHKNITVLQHTVHVQCTSNCYHVCMYLHAIWKEQGKTKEFY